MEQVISLSAAKAHLAGLVQATETGEVVHISRHGKPVAVLMSEQAYAALQGQQAGRRVWAAIANGRCPTDRLASRRWRAGAIDLRAARCRWGEGASRYQRAVGAAAGAA